MNDPLRILDSLFDGFGPDPEADFPALPTSFPTVESPQGAGIVVASHTFRSSHCKNGRLGDVSVLTARAADYPAGASRARVPMLETVGSVGSVGIGPNPPQEAGSSLFPLSSEKVGRVGSVDAASRSFPVSPDDVRAGVARELRSLAEDGREGPAALRDAIAITAAKIRNSEALAERQAHGGRCHICDQPLDDTLPVIAVLSGKPGAHLFLHAGCPDVYRARRTALVDRIMGGAGYNLLHT